MGWYLNVLAAAQTIPHRDKDQEGAAADAAGTGVRRGGWWELGETTSVVQLRCPISHLHIIYAEEMPLPVA